MSERRELTREDLDRLKVTVGDETMLLGCMKHPAAGNTVIYQDGCLRLLCRDCGFEAAKIEVALAATHGVPPERDRPAASGRNPMTETVAVELTREEAKALFGPAAMFGTPRRSLQDAAFAKLRAALQQPEAADANEALAAAYAARPEQITVEPHHRDVTLPGYYDRVNREHRPARTYSQPHGFMARRGSVSGWSLNAKAAKRMVEQIEASR